MSTTKYRVMIDPFKYQSKRHAQKNVGRGKIEIMNHPVEVTLEEILIALQNKQNVILSELGMTERKRLLMQKPGKKFTASKETWMSQQIFGLDIDNEYSVYNKETRKYETFKHEGDCYLELEDILVLCKREGLDPAAIYETLSSTKSHRKYRILFVLDQLITDYDERTHITEVLFHMFEYKGHKLADTKCRDAARIFFGAKHIVYKNEYAKTSTDHLRSIVLKKRGNIATIAATAEERKQKAKHHADKSSNEMIKLLANQDWMTIKQRVAERFKEVTKPTDSKDESLLTKVETISYIYNNISQILLVVWSPLTKPVVASSREIFYDSAKSYPLHDLFDLPLDENFSCILPGHEDSNPSARFFRDEQGFVKYICYGCCEKTYDIFNLFELFSGVSRTTARKKVGEALNISDQTLWQKEKKEELRDLAEMFRYPDRIEASYPFLHNQLVKRRMIAFMDHLIYDASLHVTDISFTNVEEAVFVADLHGMSHRLEKACISGVSKKILHKKLHIAAILGFIEFVPDDTNIYAVTIGKKRRLENNISGKEYQYRANVLKVALFTTDLFEEVERRMKLLVEQSFSFANADKRETYKWALDIIEPDKHFVQDVTQNERSPELLKVYERIKAAAEDLLDKQGYFTFEDLFAHKRLRSVKKSIQKKKELLAIVTPELFSTSEIENTYYKNNYKDTFSINQEKAKKLKPGRTKIYVRKNDERV